MSSSLRTEVIPASGFLVFGPANFLMLTETASAVTVKFQRAGRGDYEAANIEAGYVKGFVDRWERGTIEGTAGGTVRYLIGDEDIAEDFTDYRRTVGVFQEQLSASLQAPTVDVDVGGSAVAIQLVAANAARRKVTVRLLDTALTNIRVGPQATIAANRGLPLTPGESYTYEGEGAVHAIREAAAAALVAVLEELY